MKRAPALALSEARGIRRLHLGGDAIQSAMRIDDPYALALDYTRCMMAVLLFHRQPREVLMIGLGGGSLAKFFYRRMRGACVRAVELDARVIAAAREHFALPPDGARLRVELGDGAETLAPECCDLLLVDGFDDGEQAPALTSRAFYDAAWLALAAPGAMALNFMSDDPGLDRYLRRLERAFGGAVLCLPALADPNLLVFAFKGAPRRIAWDVLRARAARLEQRFALPFRRYVTSLGAMNAHTREDLIIIPDTNGGER